jgi:hypothetical protein
MSALGQKRTYALQQAMSALHPIATAKADFCARLCPLYPRKRTFAVQLGMSAWTKSRHSQSLLDDFVSARKKPLRHFKAKRFRRLKVDSEFVFSGCLYRKISRFLTLKDAIDVTCCPSELVD